MSQNLSTEPTVSNETVFGTVLHLAWVMVLTVFVGPGLALKK